MDCRLHPGCRGHVGPDRLRLRQRRHPPLASKPLAEACAAYTSAALPHGAKVTRTELRKADATLPDACIVRGQIVSSPESTIQWAVELPTQAQWNCKTLTIGGGFDGFIPTDDPWYQQLVGPRPTRT